MILAPVARHILYTLYGVDLPNGGRPTQSAARLQNLRHFRGMTSVEDDWQRQPTGWKIDRIPSCRPARRQTDYSTGNPLGGANSKFRPHCRISCRFGATVELDDYISFASMLYPALTKTGHHCCFLPNHFIGSVSLMMAVSILVATFLHPSASEDRLLAICKPTTRGLLVTTCKFSLDYLTSRQLNHANSSH